MIRTVMTLRMGSNDLQDTTFLINDTQVGYLSQSSRRNQVFSSHRYIQLIAGFRADHTEHDGQERQRESLRLWQRCSRDVQQRGLSVLPQAAGHYNLMPEWLIGLDNKYLHAWLTGDFTVCLMRDGELFQVDPVADQYSKMPDSWIGLLHQSTVEIMEGDYFLFLPPSFFDVVSAAETQNILNGMQQLSVKINKLVDLGRIRGYELDSSWIALQVQKIEFDTAQGPSFKEKIAGFTGMFKKTDPAEAARLRAESSSLRQKTPKQDSSSYGLTGKNYGGNSISDSDNYRPTEAEMAAAAARASMRYGNQSNNNDIHGLKETVDDDYLQPGGRRKSITAEARSRSNQNIKLFTIWNGWRREQKWLAVLLAISVLILVAWGVSTALNKGDKTGETTTTTALTPEATPTPIPPTETTTIAPVETKLIVMARSLNFREAPGTDAGLIVSLNEGTIVTKIEDADEGWIKVRLEDGREAYAFGEYLQEAQEESEETQE